MLGSEAKGPLIHRDLDRRSFSVATVLWCRRSKTDRTVLPKTKIRAMNRFAHKSTFKSALQTALEIWVRVRTIEHIDVSRL
jgi:hypothetical protein